MEKKCTKCGVVKDLSEFNKHKRCSYGVRNICKICHRKETALWVSQNKEKKRKTDTEYRVKNREKTLEYSRKWYGENKKSHLKRTKKYKEDNAEFYREWNKQYREDNKEYFKKYCQANKERLALKKREWNKNNKEKLLAYKRKYVKKRRAEDIPYRITNNFRGRISKMLKGKVKKESCLTFLGYSKKDLILHIESLFENGMSWENYGLRGWHIDHIRPVCSFNIKSNSCPEFKKCWALENLQPLWWKDNIRKGAREDW